MYQFPKAAIAKSHKLGGVKQEKIFSPSSGGCKSKLKVLTGVDKVRTVQGIDRTMLPLSSGDDLPHSSLPSL